MTTLPYTYEDPSGDKITVTDQWPASITVWETINGKTHRAAVHAPRDTAAVELAEAVLEAGKYTGHRVISYEELTRWANFHRAEGAKEMRGQAAAWLVQNDLDNYADGIQDLPLPAHEGNPFYLTVPVPARYRDRRGDIWEDLGDGTLRAIAVHRDRPDDLGAHRPDGYVAQHYGPLAHMPDPDRHGTAPQGPAAAHFSASTGDNPSFVGEFTGPTFQLAPEFEKRIAELEANVRRANATAQRALEQCEQIQANVSALGASHDDLAHQVTASGEDTAPRP